MHLLHLRRSLLPIALVGVLGSAAAAQVPDGVIPLPAIDDPVMDDVGSDADDVAEDVPATPAPLWYEPGYWIRPTPWDGSVQLGVTGTEGNAPTFNLAAGAEAEFKTDVSELTLKATYVKSAANSVETANNAYLKARNEWPLTDSPWMLFVNGNLEYDEFRAFDLRLAGHGGVGYQLIKTDASSLSGRFGGGVSHEIDSPDESYVPEASYGLTFAHQLTARQKVSAEADYYPSWEDYNDYRIIARASWEILLDEATNLSLKVSAFDRYDSTPQGRRPNDLDYALLLLWKL